MLKKIIIVFLCILSFIGGVSAGDWSHPVEIGYDTGVTSWVQPTQHEWNVTKDCCNGICHSDFNIYDAQNNSHKADKKKIDSSFRGKTLRIHIHWGGTPHDNNIIVPYYPGGNIKIKADYRSMSRHASWMDVSINGWHNNGLGAMTDGGAMFTLPPEAWYDPTT